MPSQPVSGCGRATKAQPTKCFFILCLKQCGKIPLEKAWFLPSTCFMCPFSSFANLQRLHPDAHSGCRVRIAAAGDLPGRIVRSALTSSYRARCGREVIARAHGKLQHRSPWALCTVPGVSDGRPRSLAHRHPVGSPTAPAAAAETLLDQAQGSHGCTCLWAGLWRRQEGCALPRQTGQPGLRQLLSSRSLGTQLCLWFLFNDSKKQDNKRPHI